MVSIQTLVADHMVVVCGGSIRGVKIVSSSMWLLCLVKAVKLGFGMILV